MDRDQQSCRSKVSVRSIGKDSNVDVLSCKRSEVNWSAATVSLRLISTCVRSLYSSRLKCIRYESEYTLKGLSLHTKRAKYRQSYRQSDRQIDGQTDGQTRLPTRQIYELRYHIKVSALNKRFANMQNLCIRAFTGRQDLSST